MSALLNPPTPPPERTCQSCCDVFHHDENCSEIKLKCCGKVSENCQACFSRWVKTSLEVVGHWKRIRCMDCGAGRLSGRDIMVLASKEVQQQYHKSRTFSILRDKGDFYHCVNCPGGQHIKDIKRNPRMVCKNCKVPTCAVDACLWHVNETCEKYRQRRAKQNPLQRFEELQSQILLQQCSRPCPRCNVPLMKDNGCQHVICRLCWTPFCWECLGFNADGSENLSRAHEKTCRFFVPEEELLRGGTRAIQAMHPHDPLRHRVHADYVYQLWQEDQVHHGQTPLQAERVHETQDTAAEDFLQRFPGLREVGLAPGLGDALPGIRANEDRLIADNLPLALAAVEFQNSPYGVLIAHNQPPEHHPWIIGEFQRMFR